MLAVGILIGVGISGRGFVDDAERNRFNAKIAGLEEQVDAATANADDLERRQQATEEFVASAYPALSARRLDGKNLAILVLGPVDPTVSAVERAIEEDGDGHVSRMRSLVLPLRLDAVESAVAAKPELGGDAGGQQAGNLGAGPRGGAGTWATSSSETAAATSGASWRRAARHPSGTSWSGSSWRCARAASPNP